jgi:type II secretion system protein H
MRVGIHGRCTGFTLIEILVVLCIVGVISVVVLLATAPGGTAQTRTEARRLATLLELALAETRASGHSIAWSPAPEGYEFLRKTDDGEWRSFADDSPYRRRTLPAGIVLEAVQLDAQPLRAGDRIVITPYGLTGEIRATIVGGSARIVLHGGVIGRINLETTAEGPQSGAWLDEGARIHVG